MANGKLNKKKTIVFSVLGGVVLIIVLLMIFAGKKDEIIKVTTGKADRRKITQVVSATGKINAVDKVVITPEVTGEIVNLPVKEGDFVRKGQLLIRIKPDTYTAQRNRARASVEATNSEVRVRKANLDQLRADYHRTKDLFARKLVSQSDLERAKSSYLQAEAELESQKSNVRQNVESLKEAQENLYKTTISAPLDGVVSSLNVEKGERVLGSNLTQGTEIMTVANLSAMEARVDVDENDVVLVSIGDTATVKIDAFGDRQFKGIVTLIGNAAKTTAAGTQSEVVNFEVRIRILDFDGKIRPGMSCNAQIQTATKNGAISVPIQAVTTRPDAYKDKSSGKPKEIVFVQDKDKARVVEVVTGISDDSYIEIKSGLKENEKVIIGPYKAIAKDLNAGSKLIADEPKKKG